MLIIFSLIIYFSKSWVKINKKDLKWMFIKSIGGVIGFFGSYIAFLYIEISTAYFIFYAGSLLGGYFLGSLLFKEKIYKEKLISLALAIVGLLLIFRANLNVSNIIFFVAALASGLGTAFWNTLAKKISNKYTAIQINFVDTLVSGSISLIISIVVRETWVLPDLSPVWILNMLFASSFIATGLLMVYGFRKLDAQTGSLIMMTEVVFGVILAFIFYQETIVATSLIGGTLIILAMILSELRMEGKEIEDVIEDIEEIVES